MTQKKGPTRKKLGDLKAVAALLEDEEGDEDSNVHPLNSSQNKDEKKGNFKPDEELIQETARVKSQRDLILIRIKKMQTSKSRVSKIVYEKVLRDYHLQIENINKLLNEKKEILKNELDQLYMFREKLTIEANRHKEILEEAQFRHYLEEFSEEQFKEVESYETREISRFQKELSYIQSYIRIHEELFDPQDLGIQHQTRSYQPVTKTIPQAALPQPQKIQEDTFNHEWEDKTPPTTSPEAREVLIIEESMESTDPQASLPVEDEGYFNSDESSFNENETTPTIASNLEVKVRLEKEGFSEPESIMDILEEIPLENESRPQTVEVAQPVAQQSSSHHKVIFIDSDLPIDKKEVVLGENTSIGRSPSNDIVLEAAKVSRQHAAINKYKDQFIIIDLKSSNGVFVNGKKIDEHTLEIGDEISIGGYKMLFQK